MASKSQLSSRNLSCRGWRTNGRCAWRTSERYPCIGGRRRIRDGGQTSLPEEDACCGWCRHGHKLRKKPVGRLARHEKTCAWRAKHVNIYPACFLANGRHITSKRRLENRCALLASHLCATFNKNS